VTPTGHRAPGATATGSARARRRTGATTDPDTRAGVAGGEANPKAAELVDSAHRARRVASPRSYCWNCSRAGRSVLLQRLLVARRSEDGRK